MVNRSFRVSATNLSDVRSAISLVAPLWALTLIVVVMSWPYLSDNGTRGVISVAAAAILFFNTASVSTMVKSYSGYKKRSRYPE